MLKLNSLSALSLICIGSYGMLLAESVAQADFWRCEISCREGDREGDTIVNTGETKFEARDKNRRECLARGEGFYEGSSATYGHLGCRVNSWGDHECETSCLYWRARTSTSYGYGSTRSEASTDARESCLDTLYEKAVTIGSMVCDD